MKEQLHNWEADIRQKVDQHEFEFDPEAWADMEGMLDKASAAGAPQAKAYVTNIFWKAGLFAFALLSIILIILRWQTSKELEQIIEISSFSIPETTMAPVDTPEKQATPEKLPELVPLPAKELKPLPKPGDYESPDLIAPVPQALQKMAPFSPLPLPAIKPLEDKGPWNEVDIKVPPVKRKRDRRKLFPDIIERKK